MTIGGNSVIGYRTVYAETGRFPLYLRNKLKIIMYYFRLLERNDNSIANKIYYILKTLDSVGCKNWFIRTREILEVHNLSFVINKNDTKQVELEVYFNKLTFTVYNDLKRMRLNVFKDANSKIICSV